MSRTISQTAEVIPISSAPSFAGLVHEPEWRTFTVECTSILRADLLTAHLRAEGHLEIKKSGRSVSVRYDLTQPRAKSIPVQVALAASTMGYAEADAAAAALTAHVAGETA